MIRYHFETAKLFFAFFVVTNLDVLFRDYIDVMNHQPGSQHMSMASSVVISLLHEVSHKLSNSQHLPFELVSRLRQWESQLQVCSSSIFTTDFVFIFLFSQNIFNETTNSILLI